MRLLKKVIMVNILILYQQKDLITSLHWLLRDIADHSEIYTM